MTTLHPEQETLLTALCEAAGRNRAPFIASGSLAGDSIQHPVLAESLDFEWSNLDALFDGRMIRRTSRSGGSRNLIEFVVTSEELEHKQQGKGPKLRPSQIKLLGELCRAAEARSDGDLLLIRADRAKLVSHTGLPQTIEIALADYVELGNAGMLRPLSLTGRDRQFAITNKGWEHWEALTAGKDAVARIEDSVGRLFDPAPKVGPYAEAFKKWAAAEAMLWTAREEPAHLTALGIVCRDSLQRFADAFAREQGYASQEPASKTINRVVGGIAALRGRLSDRHVDLLDALETYWRAVDGLVQRQVHAAEKGGEPIDWDDARVVVTQTAMVTFELARADARASR